MSFFSDLGDAVRDIGRSIGNAFSGGFGGSRSDERSTNRVNSGPFGSGAVSSSPRPQARPSGSPFGGAGSSRGARTSTRDFSDRGEDPTPRRSTSASKPPAKKRTPRPASGPEVSVLAEAQRRRQQSSGRGVLARVYRIPEDRAKAVTTLQSFNGDRSRGLTLGR